MAISYPLLHPSTPGFRSISLRPSNAVQVASSPFTGQQQVQAHQGQFWQADVQLPPIKQDTTADDWAAWLTALRGQYGTFLLGDSSRKTPRGTATGALPRPIGTISGLSISSQGWTASQTGIMKAGDYFQLGGENLTKYSQDFSQWSLQTGVSITSTNNTSPEGTNTATLLDWSSAANSTGFYSQAAAVDFRRNTKSIYLKGGSAGTAELCDGFLTTTIKTISLTTSWQRFELSESGFNAASSYLWVRKTAGSPTTIYAWGGQTNIGSEADGYHVTTSSAVSYARRLHKITRSTNSDSGGAATLDFWPRIRETPTNAIAGFKLVNAQGTFRLASEPVWSVGPDKIYDIGFSAVEAI